MRFMRYLVLTVAASLGLARAADAPMFDYKEAVLDNGLKLITLEDFSSPLVAVQLWYHVGSKDEDPKRQGFAHMFEHMMFQGTDRLGPTGHFDNIHRVGGQCNAYTAFDQTVYHEVVPASQLELALYLESERMAFLKVDQHSFDTERKVVEEERRMGVNQPYGTLIDNVLPEIYTVHPYRWSPIGQIPHLRAAGVQELRDFWTKFYVPNNATLVVVGAVKHDDVLALAKRYFGWIRKYPDPSRITVKEPPLAAERPITVKEQNAPAPLVALLFHIPPQGHPDYIPLQVLSSILCEGNSSRVYRRLVAGEQLAAYAQGMVFSLEQDGLLGLGAVLPPMGGDPVKALLALEQESDKLCAEAVTEAELTKARNQLLKSIVFASLTVEEKASLLGNATVLQGGPAGVNTQLARINAVTAADVQRVAKQYLKPERRMDITVERNLLGTLFSGFKKEEDAKITAEPELTAPPPGREGQKRPDDFPQEPPLAAAAKTNVTPQFSERTLANGLKVKVVSKHGVPFVSMQLGLSCGGWTEPKPGVANMTLELLTKGTTRHSEGDFAREMETYGIAISGVASMDSAKVEADCVSQYAERAISLLAEAALTPAFNEDEFKKLRVQIRSSLAITAAQAEYAADKELRRQLYGAHPYARTNTGEPADIDALKTEDLRAWWSQVARPDMATLIFSGDIDLDKAVALAQAAFGSWKAEVPSPEFKLPELPAPAATHIVLVNRPGSVQSQIRAGQLGLTRRDPDYFAAAVTGGYFGGAFGSRLNEVIRVKKGLTYGAHGGFTARRFAGEFHVSTFSKTETTAPAVQAVLDEIARLRVEGPTARELADQKSYMQGSFARERETPQAVANDLWMIETNGLPADFYNKMMSAVAKLSDADCLKLAQKAVDPEKLIVVVVGDAAQIKEALEKIAPVNVVESK